MLELTHTYRTNMMITPTWDEMFMSMCYLVATRSPDLSTKVGAVITTKSNEVVSVGYNGLPRGVEIGNSTDTIGVPSKLSPQNGTKYLWTEHSERNAIYNAGRLGVPTINCKLYVNFLPCSDCARGIIQSGITEVITHYEGQEAFIRTRGSDTNVWTESHEMVFGMFDEAGVTHRWLSTSIVQPRAFFSGQVVPL